jgi:hypothetical protein
MFAMKSFSLFKGMFSSMGKFGRFLTFLMFGPGQKLVDGAGKAGNSVEFNDYLRYQQDQKRKRVLPVILILLGLAVFSLPMFFMKYLKSFREHEKLLESSGKTLENAWNPDQPQLPNGRFVALALDNFMGQNQMELSFRKDETIIVISKPYPDWWEGEINGRVGLFPANLVRALAPSEPSAQVEPAIVELKEEEIPK